MKINNENEFSPTLVDGAYVLALCELVDRCHAYGVNINTVQTYQNGWCVTFENFDGDAVCHDGSYGSPCYFGDMMDAHRNDWTKRSGYKWETIGYPWDHDDVSVHSASELAFYLAELKRGRTNWEEDNEDC